MTCLHEMITLTPGKVYRDVSCLCSTQPILECTCHITQRFEFDVQPILSYTTKEQQAQTIDEIQLESKDIIGQWYVIKYDDDIYQGTIVEVSETHAKVTCMYKVGRNCFFWPNHEDTLLYLFDDVLRIIPQPTSVTGCRVELNNEIWAEITND